MNKKPIYKRVWFWILTIIVLAVVIVKLQSSIDNAKEKSTKYSWPNSKITSLIPVPESANGKIISDSEDSFWIDVYKTSDEEFTEYTQKCKDKGFTVNYSGSNDSYSAENKDGYSLDLDYDAENKTMSISLDTPNAQKPDSGIKNNNKNNNSKNNNTGKKKSSSSQNKNTSAKSSGKVSASFKKTMDSYEDFFDEYIDFMKNYNNSDDISGMISDYADYMQKYAKYMEELASINEDDLSAADAAYYIEVQARITKKLAKIS